MKRRFRIIFIMYAITAAVMAAVCVYETSIIKTRHVKDMSGICIYKNVYVTEVYEGKLKANLYGTEREFDTGVLGEDVTGCLCDITVQDGEVASVSTKTDVVSGKVLAVSSDHVDIEGYGSVKLDEDFIMYNKDSTVTENYNSIVVGYELQDFIVADGKVCGAIKSRPLLADNIRVIIKTTGFEDIFFGEVTLESDSGLVIECGDNVTYTQAGERVTYNMDSAEFDLGRIKVRAADGEVRFTSISRGNGTPEYGGSIEITRYDGGIVVVNEINIEEYLKKVVPSEMPSGYNIEALKCQAVCARSYAYTELSNNYYSEYGAHIDDSIQYQVYNNSARADSTDRAVDETAGQVLTYNGEAVKTYYYSTSCGSTTDVTLWGSRIETYPYYAAECVGSANKGYLLTVESEFAQFIKSTNSTDYDYGCVLYRWSMEESVEQISRCFNSYSATDVGNIQNIEVTERVNGGAAVSVRVTGDKGETVIEGESAIRAAFGNADVDMNTMSGTARYSNLPSTFCIFEKITDGNTLIGFRITGGGYGHGIGMSQNAANKMAETMNYAQILEFFYPGTALKYVNSD